MYSEMRFGVGRSGRSESPEASTSHDSQGRTWAQILRNNKVLKPKVL